MPYLLTEEAVDPGITQVYNDPDEQRGTWEHLLVAGAPRLPHTTFGDSQTHFGRSYGATLLAIRTADGLVVSPAWDTPVNDGATLYYVGSQRILAGDLVRQTGK